jgi:ankyrin repeat protein
MSNEIDREYIFRIVHLGDSQEFLEILDRNHTLNINIQNEAGESLLIHCVKRLKTKWKAVFGGEFRTICKILIKRNIDVNLQDASGKTAANYAAEFEQLEVLKLLILKGAHLSRAVLDSVIDKEDWILSICASFAKDSELESGANSGQVSQVWWGGYNSMKTPTL